jgi:hypothetical protein
MHLPSLENTLLNPDDLEAIFDDLKFSFRGGRNKGTWIKCMSAAIELITGYKPSYEEVKDAYILIDALDRNFKQVELTREQVINMLPYFITYFKIHTNNHFTSDSNSIEESAQFFKHICNTENINSNSLLCAHRDHTIDGVAYLISHSIREKALQVLNLQQAMLVNSKTSNVTINWFQQGPTKYASANMFPDMFIGYIERGEIPLLLEQLEHHWIQIDSLRDETIEGVEFQLMELDEITKETIEYLNQNYANWNTQAYNLKSDSEDRLIENALLIMPNIKRFMPFLQKSIAQQQKIIKSGIAKNAQLNPTTREAIEWFAETQVMTLAGKALYESVFYFICGKRFFANNGVYIGIERDHSEYQSRSFKHSYSKPQYLYARRSKTGLDMNNQSLSGNTIRQFWRNPLPKHD